PAEEARDEASAFLDFGTTPTFPAIFGKDLAEPEPTPTPVISTRRAIQDITGPGENDRFGWFHVAGGFLVLVIFVLLAVWGRSILVRLFRRKRFQEAALLDEQPSVDERLLSELTTLPVVLVRGSIPAYYEKVFSLMRRLLRNRGLIDEADKTSDAIMEQVHASGADPGFIDMVESICHRCDAAALRGERPDKPAHEKIARDLKVLISMRAVEGTHRERPSEHPGS
ncbi:hypothetical protein HQ520_09545, partial [bacterium]|nr:hypothetical protein [bacterium]